MDAVAHVEGEVRELIRRGRVDPGRDAPGVRRLVEDAVADYDERSLSGTLPPVVDIGATVKAVLDAVAGFGPLQPYLDDPEVEEVWINEPTMVRKRHPRWGSAPHQVGVPIIQHRGPRRRREAEQVQH